MENLQEFSITVILTLQSLGVWLLAPMQAFTFLGNELFYLMIAPAFLWCLDARLGMRMGMGLMISGVINSILKLVFLQPRPSWISNRLVAYSGEISFGIPSGHSQNAVVVWGLLAKWIARPWAWGVAIFMMLMIGISRLYLGVHFLHDVLLGWLVGALLLWALIALEKPVMAKFNTFQPSSQALLLLGASLGMILLAGLVRMAQGNYEVPETWSQNARAADPLAEPIEPLALSGVVANAGVFFGLGLGALLLRQRGWINSRGTAWQLLARFGLGLVGVLLLWFGLGAILPRGEALLPYALRYLRYGLIGLWISGLAPMLFLRLGLAKTEI